MLTELERAFDSVPDERKLRFANAAKLSLRIDLEDGLPCPASPFDLSGEHYRFTLTEQRKWFLAVTKPTAMQFLNRWSYVPDRVARSLNVDHYRAVFGADRRIPTVPGRENWLLLTYAEWLHMLGGPSSEPELPPNIKKFLNRNRS